MMMAIVLGVGCLPAVSLDFQDLLGTVKSI